MIGEAAGETGDEAEPIFDLLEQDAAAVGGHPAPVEPSHHVMTADRWKPHGLPATLCRHETASSLQRKC